MITRDITEELLESAREYPAVTILGPRQSGKTTLARATFPDKPYYSLEDPDIRLFAESDPRGFLSETRNSGAILDEIQRLPLLLSYLQGMVDQDPRQGRFILTGSHQPALSEKISQSLAGRTAVLGLWPLSINELRQRGPLPSPFALAVKGFFPGLHEKGLDPRRFFNSYLQTYVERDLRSMVQVRDLSAFQKFLVLMAGRIGQLTNLSSLSNDTGVSATTVRNWLSVLRASYVLFELPPFFENIGKRLVKSSKFYFVDTGLAAFLLGLHTEEQVRRDPLRGSLYENLVIGEILKCAQNRGRKPDFFFYRDSRGNEVDLLVPESGRLFPVEIKSAETFTRDFTRGLENFRSLGLPRSAPGLVLYNGPLEFEAEGLRVLNPFRQETDLFTLVTSLPPAAENR
ncbi:MAG: ATP-binding protein [Nitrospirae bacterium]|nr:ATP-binding protein [Nitrospirota bacterium]